jgi:hypothetical protein
LQQRVIARQSYPLMSRRHKTYVAREAKNTRSVMDGLNNYDDAQISDRILVPPTFLLGDMSYSTAMQSLMISS